MVDSLIVEARESASGSLQKTPAVNLLVYAFEKRLTGRMQFTEDAVTVGVTLRDGWIYGVDHSTAEHALSFILEEKQLLAPGVGASSFEAAQKKGVPHGQHLIESGILSQEKLAIALRVQMTRKLTDIFLMSEAGRFSFTPVETAIPSDNPKLDPLAVAWQGLRQRPPWKQINNVIMRVGPMRLQLTERATVTRFEFSGEELAAAQVLQKGPASIAELVAQRLLGSSAAQVFTYALVIGKCVTLVPASSTPMPGVKPVSGPSPAPPMTTSTTTPESAISRSTPFGAAMTTPGKAMAPLSTPTATTSSKPSMPAVTPSTRQLAGTPLAFSPTPGPVQTSTAPTRRSSGEVALGRQKTPMAFPPSHLSPADAALAKKIQERASKIEVQNYFEMLDLEVSADAGKVNESYFAQVKEWHPDRLPKSLEHVKLQCASVFSHITEAHRTLTDPTKRAEYMVLVKEGGASPAAQRQVQGVLDAIGHFQRAEVFIKAREWQKAAELLRVAVELDPKQADYLAAQAWVEAQTPEGQSKDATQRLILALTKAISLNEKCERAYMARGMLFKRLDNQKNAQRDFQKVTDLNPRNIDAAREVRLFNMRGKSVPPSGASGATESGLLSKFFKK